MGLISLVALMWASLLLTAAYFVLFTLNKVEGSLKAFGKLVAAVLLIAALAISATGIYTAVTGENPMMGSMQKRSKVMSGPRSAMKRVGKGLSLRGHSMTDMGSKCGATTKPAEVQAQ